MFFVDAALEELSFGDFDVGGTDVDDETIENEFDVDDKTTEDGVTGAAPAPERERFDVYFKDRAVFDVDALEELSLGNFDVGIDVDDKTIDNKFDVDDEATEDGVTGAAEAAK